MTNICKLNVSTIYLYTDYKTNALSLILLTPEGFSLNYMHSVSNSSRHTKVLKIKLFLRKIL